MISIKHAVRAAIVAGAMVAASAAQALDLPASGNGSLVLFVTNTTTNQVYARDLGLHVDDLITQGTGAGQNGDPAFGAVNTLNLSLNTIGPDATLTSFLGTGSTSEFTWNIIGGDSIGNNSFLTARRFAFTSPSVNVTPPANTILGTLGTAEGNLFNQVNATLAGNNSIVAAAGQTGGAIDITLVNGHFGQSPQSTVGALDSSLNFYLFSSAAGGNATPSRLFVFNDLQLSATGILSSVASTEVPLPAAVWLFGSGLLGMAGIGRRRKLANGQQTA
jgi:hypothetical protein